MAHSPQILLADEPTASLDTDTGRDLVQLMFKMGREHGCTMIIATHDQKIINLADAFLPLRDGRIEKEDG
jgi:putative ABC transport system ATP-binding protein